MADLTRAITYRGIDLNDAAPQLGKPGLTGCSVESFDPSEILLNQYIDKRSQTDGMDFQGRGNLEEGLRKVIVQGTLYGPTRKVLFDDLVALRDALDPVQAYRSDQSTGGYLPLAFSVPTGSAGATISQYILVRPGGIRYLMDRDRQGTAAKVSGQGDATALGLPWQCEFNARDPRIYGALHTVNLTGTVAGNWTNAGDYPSLVDLTFIVGAAGGSIHVVLGGADMTLTVPGAANNRTIKYRGRTKLLTVLDAVTQVESLRMDIMSFAVPNSDTQHPLIQPGVSAYAVTATGVALQTGSNIAFSDAYA